MGGATLWQGDDLGGFQGAVPVLEQQAVAFVVFVRPPLTPTVQHNYITISALVSRLSSIQAAHRRLVGCLAFLVWDAVRFPTRCIVAKRRETEK